MDTEIRTRRTEEEIRENAFNNAVFYICKNADTIIGKLVTTSLVMVVSWMVL